MSSNSQQPSLPSSSPSPSSSSPLPSSSSLPSSSPSDSSPSPYSSAETIKDQALRHVSSSVAIKKSDLPPFEEPQYSLTKTRLWFSALFGLALWAAIFLAHPSFAIFAVPYAYFLYLSAKEDETVQPQIQLTRQCSSLRVQEHEVIRVRLTLTNLTDAPLDLIELYDRLPVEAVLVAGSNHLLGSLDAHETLTFVYEVEFLKRGLYQLGDTDVRIRNYMQTHALAFTIETKEIIQVIPRYTEMHVLKLMTRLPHKPGIFANVNKAGVGDEFYGIREYVRGDDFRKVNWKATARRGELLVNENMWKRSIDFIIVLDATENTLSVLDQSVRGVLSLADFLYSFRNRVGFYRLSDPMAEMRLSADPHRLHELTDLLIDVTGRKVSNISVRLSRVIQMSTAYTIVTVFTPLLNADLINWMIETRRNGIRIICISPNPLKMEEQIAHSSPNMQMANMLLQLDRQASFKRLTEAGIAVIDWDPTVPLEKALEASRRPINVL